MARQAKFKGTIGYTSQPVGGVMVYQQKKGEPTIDEMLEELDRSDIRAARKQELLARIGERIATLSGKKEEKSLSNNPKRYMVDPETGRIEVVEDGEYTYKDALTVSASIKGKAGDYQGAINLIRAARELAADSIKPAEERKKEFYVDDQGVIRHDPENGELTLSEARATSQSIQRNASGPPPSYYVDQEGNVHQASPGEPVVVKQKETQPSKNYLVDQSGNLREIQPGQPVVVKVERQTETPPSTPIQLRDRDGNPMTMDINSLISWKKFESEENRADEDHKNKQDVAGALIDFLGKIGKASERFATRHE